MANCHQALTAAALMALNTKDDFTNKKDENNMTDHNVVISWVTRALRLNGRGEACRTGPSPWPAVS